MFCRLIIYVTMNTEYYDPIVYYKQTFTHRHNERSSSHHTGLSHWHLTLAIYTGIQWQRWMNTKERLTPLTFFCFSVYFMVHLSENMLQILSFYLLGIAEKNQKLAQMQNSGHLRLPQDN